MTSHSLTFRTEVQPWTLIPAKVSSGRLSSKGEPDVAAGVPVELAEAREKHEAPALGAKPRLPVRARRVADVRRAAVRFHAEESVEVDGLALRPELVGTPRRYLIQRSPQARHTPSHHRQRALALADVDDRRGVSGKMPGCEARLPARSRSIANRRRIASWAVVWL